MRRLNLSSEAGADIKAIFRWYELQQPGLGREFRLAIPFEVFYEFDGERVVVHLVFHTSQDPDKWRERLGLL